MSPGIEGGLLEGALAASGVSAGDSLLPPQPAKLATTAAANTIFKSDDVIVKILYI